MAEHDDKYERRSFRNNWQNGLDLFIGLTSLPTIKSAIYSNPFIDGLKESLKDDFEIRNFKEEYKALYNMDDSKAEYYARKSAFPRILNRKISYMMDIEGLDSFPSARNILEAVFMNSIHLIGNDADSLTIDVDTPREITEKVSYFSKYWKKRYKEIEEEGPEEGFEEERDTVKNAREFYQRRRR